MSFKLLSTLTAAILTSIMFPGGAAADTFNAKWLLEQSEGTQNFFIQTAISTAGSIAGQAHPEIEACMDKWFPPIQSVREERYQEVIRYMRKFPDHSPTAVVIATIQKNCGKFKDTGS